MDEKLIEQIRQRMEEKSTEELLKIWEDNDREEWSDEAFAAIHSILAARDENSLPQAQIMDHQLSAVDKPSIHTFTVYEVRGFRKQLPWTVNLTPTQAEFICQETDRQFSIPRDNAHTEIKFAQAGLFMTEGTIANISKTSFDFKENKSQLERWFPPKTLSDMQKDLRGWGVGIIAVGVLSIILSHILDPVWGAVLIALGIMNLLVNMRVMFIINGLALIAVGVLNIMSVFSALASTRSTYSSIYTGLVLFGGMQIVWGAQEIRKYDRYASAR